MLKTLLILWPLWGVIKFAFGLFVVLGQEGSKETISWYGLKLRLVVHQVRDILCFLLLIPSKRLLFKPKLIHLVENIFLLIRHCILHIHQVIVRIRRNQMPHPYRTLRLEGKRLLIMQLRRIPVPDSHHINNSPYLSALQLLIWSQEIIHLLLVRFLVECLLR